QNLQEMTAESESGHVRRETAVARPLFRPAENQTDLRHQIMRCRTTRHDNPEMEALRKRFAELKTLQNRRARSPPNPRSQETDHVYVETDSPLSLELTLEPLPEKIKVPQIGLYDGTSDPDAHLGHYTSWMDLHGATDALRCRMFSLTLGPRAQKWYYSLPAQFIRRWVQLRSVFRSHFIGAQVCLIPKESITNIVQKDDESLKEYVARFNERVQNMEPCHPETLLVSAISGLKPKSMFRCALCQNEPNTFQEFWVRAQNHVIAEESMSVPDLTFTSQGQKSTSEKKKNLLASRPRRPPLQTRDGETRMIPRYEQPGNINTNRDALTSSRRQAKAYARRAYNSRKQVMTSDLRETINARTCPITFTLEDASLFDHPHSDALIITTPICGIPVHRIMVDTGAYTSIRMLKAFNKLGIDPAEVRPCNDRVHVFNGSIALPLGEITLPIRFGGQGQTSKVIMETFKVMDLDNEYNAIIGRKALYKLRAAVSIFHYAIKFPTADGEGTHYGEQREAKE
ncbi:Unknown protein, partial [Striga hermonthica]